MWVELICGLVIFRLLKRFFYDDGDADILDAETFSSDATVLFTVADRLEKLYGGKAYVGLQIPDPEAATTATRTPRQNIDIVVVAKRWQKPNNRFPFLNHILNKEGLRFQKDIYLIKSYVLTQISVLFIQTYFHLRSSLMTSGHN